MKTITYIAILLFTLTISAQKTVYVFNSSNSDFDIGHIRTKDAGASAYPQFESYTNVVTIPAHFVAQFDASPFNTTTFPFYTGPTNVFYQWILWSSPTNYVGTLLTSQTVATSYGTSQIFDFAKTQVRRNNAFGPPNNVGGGNLRPTVITPYDWRQYSLSQGGLVTITEVTPGGEIIINIQD